MSDVFPYVRMKYLTKKNYKRWHVTKNVDIEKKEYYGSFIDQFYIGLSSMFDSSFRNFKITDGNITGVSIDECRFDRCSINNVEFYDCHITDCVFENLDAKNIIFFGCFLFRVKFINCDLKNIYFKQDNVGHRSGLMSADLINTDVSKVDFGNSEVNDCRNDSAQTIFT